MGIGADRNPHNLLLILAYFVNVTGRSASPL